MDWNRAIEKNREALKQILTALVAMAGLRGRSGPEARSCLASGTTTGGQGPDAAGESGDPEGLHSEDRPTLPRHLHRAVLRLLRPAEAAARRLIIVAARDMPAPSPRPRKPAPPAWPHRAKPAGKRARNAHRPSKRHDKARPPKPTAPDGSFSPTARRVPALPLFDTLRPFRAPARPRAAGVPRISVPGYTAPFPVAPRRAPLPDDPIDAARLVLRLRTLEQTLDDLPAHARRFARWRASRDALRGRERSRDAAGAQDREYDAAGAQKREHDAIGAQEKEHYAPAQGERHGAAGAQPGNHPAWRRLKGGQHVLPRRPAARRIWPLRPGRPPGARRRPDHEVHHVLTVVHDLAIWAMERPDTS